MQNQVEGVLRSRKRGVGLLCKTRVCQLNTATYVLVHRVSAHQESVAQLDLLAMGKTKKTDKRPSKLGRLVNSITCSH